MHGRSNKWHWERDCKSISTKRSKSDNAVADSGEWHEGEREPPRAKSEFETRRYGDGSQLPRIRSEVCAVLQFKKQAFEHSNVRLARYFIG